MHNRRWRKSLKTKERILINELLESAPLITKAVFSFANDIYRFHGFQLGIVRLPGPELEVTTLRSRLPRDGLA